MNDYKNIPSLRGYVRVKENKDIEKLEEIGQQWASVAAENRLSYEIDWLGIPVIQTPEDLVLMQELIFRIQPEVIIETGVAHGGSLIYYASLMELLGKGKVVGVDIEIREHNRKAIEAHPLSKRVELVVGSSISAGTLREVKKRVPAGSSVIVCLDSDHTKPHVLKELQLYQQFIRPGGYIVVFDTVISKLAAPGNSEEKYINNSPREAVDEFLRDNKDFEIDKSYNRLFVSSTPDGYLRRIK